MRTGFVLFVVCIWLVLPLRAQVGEKRYEDYLQKERNPVALQYLDPYFPTEPAGPGVRNDRMEEYAKLHQPIPLQQNTGNPEYDKAKCEQDQALWLQMNPYYPQFIPYHLYNYRLTPEDDIRFYETAVAAWKKANPVKAEEINNTVK